MNLALGALLLQAVSAAAAPSPPAAPPSPEVQLCLQSFREGERARAEKALGPLEALTLYRAELTVDPEGRTVTGNVSVQVTASGIRPLSSVYLRVTPNAFGAGRVKLGAISVDGVPQSVDHPEPGLYRVRLRTPLSPGASVGLTMPLTARVPTEDEDAGLGLGMGGKGAAFNDHGAFSSTSAGLSLVGILPQVPPLDANGEPWAGPGGFGDIALYGPGNYLVTVRAPRGFRVVAPGRALGEVPQPDGAVRYTFGIAASRDFPLFVLRGDTVLTEAVGAVTVEAHVHASDAPSGRKMLGVAAAALTEFQRRLGPYPYQTFRVVEAPLSGGAGGMEFPGLVTIAASLIRGQANPLAAMGIPPSMAKMLAANGGADLFSSGMAPMLGHLLEFTVAHEVAHQYFAGLVGSDPIREPVVDETLAQYSALLYLEWKHGAETAEAMKTQQLIPSYQIYRMTGGADGPAARATTAFASSIEYGALVYGKAPLLHEAERKLVGDTVFFDALRAYVEQYRYQWASVDSLTRVLASKAPEKRARLQALRHHWWNEAHGDEDLGEADLGKMMEGITGVQMDEETQALVKQLLPGLLGQ